MTLTLFDFDFIINLKVSKGQGDDMRISDKIDEYIRSLFESDNDCVEIRRNELAALLGCVPSQINYVITSRFSPEHGYIVESRRGCGGFIRITRVISSSESEIMSIINAVGDDLSYSACVILLKNMIERELLSSHQADLIHTAISQRSLAAVPQTYRDLVRASTLKNMLVVILNK